jgi:hypothetical protein
MQVAPDAVDIALAARFEAGLLDLEIERDIR